MIEKIKIENFQSHKESELNFDPGVNVIVGQSDSGKTAIIRAFKWAAQNKPLGDAFRSRWGGDTAVTLQTNDCQVIRHKGKKDHYELTLPDDDGAESIKFTAFGTAAPEEITAALNLSDLNLQEQMDSSFLLSQSAGEVARHFNKVAGIDQIDTGLKNVERWVRAINQTVSAVQTEIERKEKELESFDYLDKFEAEVEVLEQLESQRDHMHGKATKLNKLISDLEEIDTEVEGYAGVLASEDQVTELLGLFDTKREKKQERAKLIVLCKKIIDTASDIKEYQALQNAEEPVSELLELYKFQATCKQNAEALQKIISNVEECAANHKQQQTGLKDLEQQWHDNMPETCPLCGK